MLREFGIGLVPYSPLGHGFLTGTIRDLDDLDDSDWRKTNPCFTGDNFQRNLRIPDEVAAIAAELDATHLRADQSIPSTRDGRRAAPLDRAGPSLLPAATSLASAFRAGPLGEW